MKYTDSHEWIRVSGKRGTVGISSHAQKELGEVVHIHLPKIGTEIDARAEIAVIESTKAAVDIYAPVSGKIVKVNTAIQETISLLNESPESEGWLFEIEIKDLSELNALLDLKAYHSLF